MKSIIIPVILLVMFIGLLPASSSGQAATPSKKEINTWYKQRQWLNGLSRVPNNTVDRREFAKQYSSNKAGWDKAFAYLKETDLESLKAGKYAIDGENVFAIVSEGSTKELDKTMWEAHKNYHDIHFIIRGKEKIGITPLKSATILKAYDPLKDIGFYTSKGEYFISDTTNLFIVLAEVAHRPGVKAEGAETMKKVVIKVRKIV
jgi:biofilm protein TabA